MKENLSAYYTSLSIESNFRVFISLCVLFISTSQAQGQNINIVSVSPQPYNYNVPAGSNIQVIFDQNIEATTLVNSNVMVRGSMSNVISGTLSGGGTNTLIFDPDIDFRFGEMISITLTNAITSEVGQPLARGHTYSFTVISGVPPSSPLALAQRNIGTTVLSPDDVKTIDFDGDGDLDIITGSDAFVETTALYENDGSQNFCRSVLANFRNVEVHDLDGDGDMDAFGATGAFDTELNWFENEGSFPFTERFISSRDPWALTGGDIDSDGDIDLLAATLLPDQLRWFPNDGLGNFSAPISITSSFDGGSNSFLKVADINSDGAMDILAFYEDLRAVVWLENDGGQNFTEHIIDNTTNRQRFDHGDIDQDGDIDIIIATTDNSTALISWYENDGTENFTAQLIPVTATNPLEDIKLTDLDGDMDIDILSGSFWFENDGTQNFTQHLMSEGLIQGSHPYTRSVSFADLENDGDMDVITLGLYKLSWQENSLFMQISNTSPTNAVNSASANTNITVNFSESIEGSTLNNFNFSVTNQYGQKITGTFSGAGSSTIIFDPDADFIPGEKVYVSINELLLSTSGHSLANKYGFEFTIGQSVVGTPSFVSNSVFLHPSDVFRMAISDLDSDGDIDIISCSLDDLIWFENNGTGLFTNHVIPTSAIPVDVVTLDINEDGFMDMIVDFSSSDPTKLYLNDGTQNFSESDINQFSTLVRDFDHDGFLDFINANSWLNNQDNCGIYQTTGIQSAQTNRITISVGDADNDGDLDLFRAGSTGTILDTNYGAMNFILASTMNSVWTNDQILIDLDSDGDLDFVVVERFVGLAWFENRLNEASNDIGSRQGIGNLNQDPRATKAADFDGDGDPDLVAISRNDDLVVWYENRLNEPEADFAPAVTVGLTANGPIQLEVGDMDNDGDLDIVTLSDMDDEVIWFENTLAACSAPIIQTQPISQTALEGENITLSVVASGASLSYQWTKDAIDIANATSATLQLTNLTQSDAGSYICLVSNSCETVTSSSATLTVTPCSAPTIQTQPISQTVLEGEDVTFSVVASGASLTYQWAKDAIDIVNATSATLQLTNLSQSDAGSYACMVSNNCETVISNVATLMINSPSTSFVITDPQQSTILMNGQQTSVDFGQTSAEQSITRSFLIENTGTQTLSINSITSTDQAFSISNVPEQVPATSNSTFDIIFSALQPGFYTSNINVLTDAGSFLFPVSAEITNIPTTTNLTVFNALAPNGNGKHDFFKIENIESFSNNSVQIFNRWGKKVYEVSGYDNENIRFEGQANVGGNKNLIEGTYFYVIDTGSEQKTGFLMLRR